MPDANADVSLILDDADRTLVRLEKMCCDPGRSPQMSAIAADLAGLRASLTGDGEGHADLDVLIARMEATGGRIGRLQVGCCAPARMPLYADLLQFLTDLPRNLNAEAGRGH